jgi:aminopeptidase N
MLEAGREDFFSTACHEFMHNFFYGIYGTDENLNHWMDEGLTSYAEARMSTVVTNSTENPASEAGMIYKWVRTQYPEEPISTAANFFAADYAYYNCAYYKGQLFPELIRYMIGDSIMRLGFKKYYQNWSFKHPEPNDFVKNFEDVSRMELTWFQNYWLNTTKTIDFGIDSVTYKGPDAFIVFSNKGLPMPIEFTVEYTNGSKKYFYIPLDLTNNPKTNFMRPTTTLPYWSGAEKKYRVLVKDIKKSMVANITIDTDGFMPDLKPANNTYIPKN